MKVVATRRHEELEKLLGEAGHDVIVAAVIETRPPEDGGAALRAALDRLETYDWLVVTSANGARAVASAELSEVKVAAVGAQTAAALPVEADLVPNLYEAAALVDIFPAGPGRVLAALAADHRPTLPEGLRAAGWEVDVVAAYRTVQIRPDPAAVEQAATADAITFLSPSAVRGWVVAIDVLPGTVVCIGPVTAAAAHEAGLVVDAVADPHTVEALVGLLS